ncbi:MAG: DUF3094 family protein [Halioglobus sp.]
MADAQINAETGAKTKEPLYQAARSSSSDVDKSFDNSLYPEDQKKVDEFITRGVNSVERKPFRPLLLMGMLIVVVTSLSVLSQMLATWAGVH